MCGLASKEMAKWSGPVPQLVTTKKHWLCYPEDTPEVTLHPQVAVNGHFTPQVALASLLTFGNLWAAVLTRASSFSR